MLTEEAFRETSGLSQTVFERLLAWLDDGDESGGERYLEIRQRLVTYFDRRNRPRPEELADETLDRVARTLEQSGVIAVTPPARYCYVVARFVLLEDIRQERRQVALDDAAPGRLRPHGDDVYRDRDAREERLNCLDNCLEQLKPEQRSLILEYYRDTKRQKIERRRELAGRLSITMNALAIRASRIRDAVLTCMRRCGSLAKDFGPHRPIN